VKPDPRLMSELCSLIARNVGVTKRAARSRTSFSVAKMVRPRRAHISLSRISQSSRRGRSAPFSRIRCSNTRREFSHFLRRFADEQLHHARECR